MRSTIEQKFIALLAWSLLSANVAAAAPTNSRPAGTSSLANSAPNAIVQSSTFPRIGLDPAHLRDVIVTAYKKLELYSAGSGAGLTLDVDAVGTYDRRQFRHLRWLDLVDPPDGRLVTATRKVHHHYVAGATKPVTDLSSAVYVPRWLTAEASWKLLPWGPGLDKMSVAQVLDSARARTGSEQVVALSAYTVTASMAGESRVYHAAFLWMEGREDGKATFTIADNIVKDVESAVQESIPPVITENGPIHLKTSRRAHLAPRDEASSCIAQTITLQSAGQASSGDDHLTGSHASQAGFTISCQCDASCSQTCTAAVNGGTCRDTGITYFYLHWMAEGQNTSSTSSSAGDQVAASCGAGYGCVEKNCFLGLCGSVTIGVSVTGPSVTFTPGGAPDWSGNQQFAQTCPLCQKPTPPPTGGGGGGDGGGGGGDGGGGGGGSVCNDGDLVTADECVFMCGGEVDEDAGLCLVF